MCNLNSISFEFENEELKLLKNENKCLNGEETFDLIFKININDIFNENDYVIFQYINVHIINIFIYNIVILFKY